MAPIWSDLLQSSLVSSALRFPHLIPYILQLTARSEHFVHVEDTARLHLAAVVLSEVQGERIFAWAEPWNFDLLLGILRTQNPDREFVPDFHSRRDLSDITEPKKRAVELLGRLGRVDGFTPIAESIRLNTQDLF